jgi:UDP-N-acetylglucosamine--N-acetylmuramyl-(pentapeptide) pyrophosphoryl-undecaprenol N-acetylglucosamine transferase
VKVLILAGGTGGHVYPAVAVARELAEQHVHLVWLGTKRGLEARAVPAANLPIEMEWVSMRGLRGGGLLRWLSLPFNLALGVWQSLRAVRRHRPDVMISFGGFVAAPGGIAAWLTQTPLVIHEQNAIAGWTNKLLAFFSRRVLTGFPNVFGGGRPEQYVGNPVRKEILNLPDPQTRLQVRSGPLRVLVVGGSQGAQSFNEIIPRAILAVPETLRPEVWHQCGRHRLAETQTAYAGANARVAEFIDNMGEAYAWADLVICRAGAMTVAELCAAGVAAVLVPFPFAVDDHQTANAQFLVERDAAILVPQKDLSAQKLSEWFVTFTGDRAALIKMALAARGAAVLDAAEVVAHECLEAAHA